MVPYPWKQRCRWARDATVTANVCFVFYSIIISLSRLVWPGLIYFATSSQRVGRVLPWTTWDASNLVDQENMIRTANPVNTSAAFCAVPKKWQSVHCARHNEGGGVAQRLTYRSRPFFHHFYPGSICLLSWMSSLPLLIEMRRSCAAKQNKTFERVHRMVQPFFSRRTISPSVAHKQLLVQR